MSSNRWMHDANAIAEVDQLYSFIGQFVVSFQWVENKLLDIAHLALGFEKWDETKLWFTGLRAQQKIDEVKKLVETCAAQSAKLANQVEELMPVFDLLHQQRVIRNSLLHSQYLFEFLPLGGPPLKFDSSRRDGTLQVDEEGLSKKERDQKLSSLFDASIGLGRIAFAVRANAPYKSS